ncbi:Rha family transcriptional regulator [Ancylobacter sonchi]
MTRTSPEARRVASGGTRHARTPPAGTFAEFFERRHDNVLRDIKGLLEEAPSTALNFKASSYKNSAGRTLPDNEMTLRGPQATATASTMLAG